MTWLILSLLVLMQGIAAAVIVKGIALAARSWFRWCMGIGLILTAIVVSLVGMWACFNAHVDYFSIGEKTEIINDEGKPVPAVQVTSRAWTWRHVFLHDYPLPTIRLFVLTLGLSMPALAIGLVLIGLRGNPKDQGLPRAKSWQASRICMALGACALLLVASVYLNDRAICREIEACKRRGDELAQSVAPRPCADVDNAAVIYAQAGQIIRHGPSTPPGNFDALRPTSRDSRWREYAQANRAAANLMRDGARRPHCRLKNDWEHAPNADASSKDVDDIRAGCYLLMVEGMLELLNGNADRAYSNASALRRIAEHISMDPRESAQFNAPSAEYWATQLIEHAMYARAPSAGDIADLRRPDIDFRSRLYDLMVWSEAEACQGIRDTYLGRSLDDEEVADPPGNARFSAAITLASRMFYARDDIYAAPLLFGHYQQSAYRFRPDWNKSIRVQPLPDAYTAFGAPVTGRYIGNVVVHYHHFAFEPGATTYRRLADLALKMHEQDLLKSIRDLGPDAALPVSERPIDPMNDKPLQIVVRDGGIVIYSVGRDYNDDGGEEMRRFDRGDLTFCLGEAFRVRRLEKQPEEGTN